MEWRNVIDCYRELPESTGNIPDEVIYVATLCDQQQKLEKILAETEIELQTAGNKMLKKLLKYWTQTDIDKTGLRDCY